MNQPILNIWDTVGLGIIIEHPTGVLISNQTGGTACLHPKTEGIYLPLRNDYTEKHTFLSPEIALHNYFTGPKYNGSGAIKGIDLEDITHIQTILAKSKLDQWITIDTEKQAQSHEAWIWIKLNNTQDNKLIKGFKNERLTGVLTWSNSD